MFGLPIFRRKTTTVSDTPIPCYYDVGTSGCTINSLNYDPVINKCVNLYGCDEYKPKLIKSALRLAQMVTNHYSIIISSDWRHISTWGSVVTYGRTGISSNTNTPQTAIINWQNGPQSIIKMFSRGGGWFGSYPLVTIFKTENNELYGTGQNSAYLLNRNKNTDDLFTYEYITKDVVEFCVASHHMLYIKTNGKVYGLGEKNVGFGFSLINQKALTRDYGTDSNYLGVSNASKVYTVDPDSYYKSFVLLNDGTVMACGYNTHGCLGVNKADPIVYEWSKVKKSDNSDLTDVVDIITTNWVYTGGANQGGTVISWTGEASDTFMATYFLTKDGSVYTCGSNNFGQLGLGLITTETRIYATKTSITNASQICTTAGGTSVLVTTTEDTVYTWGNNLWGQLGLGHTNHTSSPAQATFPTKKIKIIHGGGMYGITNGAFLIVCDDGTLYAAGFNQTYALGITTAGVPNAGPIKTFTRNEYFGINPTQNQDTRRYPINGISVTGDILNGSCIITNATLSENKTVFGSPETVYITNSMSISGNGIQDGSEVRLIDRTRNEITISLPAYATQTNTHLSYSQIIKVYQADLCGYGTEMAQKVVTEDGTLYMSGWNQNVGGIYNFNANADGGQNVGVPTAFDAHFS